MPEAIRSRANALVKQVRALRSRTDVDGPCLLEGGKLVVEALAAGARLAVVLASPRAATTAHGRAALEAAAQAGVEVRELEDDLMDEVSEVETSQGLLALAERPAFADDAVFGLGRAALVLVAVEVQNPANLGALLRSAEGAGATGALLTRGCADAFSWKALRGSMGSAFRLPHLRGLDPGDALARLRARGLRLAAAETSGAVDCWSADLRGPLALVLGNEARGLPAAVAAACDLRVRVPLAAPVESLNVGAAAAVLLFEAARQRGIIGGS
jgi:TrmH family RNA methyltransferase